MVKKEALFDHIMVQGLNKEYIFDNDIDKKEYIKIMKNTNIIYL